MRYIQLFDCTGRKIRKNGKRFFDQRYTNEQALSQQYEALQQEVRKYHKLEKGDPNLTEPPRACYAQVRERKFILTEPKETWVLDNPFFSLRQPHKLERT